MVNYNTHVARFIKLNKYSAVFLDFICKLDKDQLESFTEYETKIIVVGLSKMYLYAKATKHVNDLIVFLA